MRTNSPWLPARTPKPAARLRLFCFPYAGGSATAYRHWQQMMPPAIEVLPVELPGRGARTQEQLYTRLDSLLGALGPALLPEMALPFAFFGHSMGGLIAFELARWLKNESRALPAHLFISAKSCPEHQEEIPSAPLSDAQLITTLRDYEGTAAEVLENAELMGWLAPIIRADMELCDTWVSKSGLTLECPMTVFGGLNDGARPRQALEGWKKYTTSSFRLHMFPGGHFFIQKWGRAMTEIIARQLLPSLVAT